MRDLYFEICEYINREWILKRKGSKRSFAEDLDVDEKTIRQISKFKDEPYKISLYTLEKMCTAKGLSLEKFFRLLGR